jgi:hypothetical protein
MLKYKKNYEIYGKIRNKNILGHITNFFSSQSSAYFIIATGYKVFFLFFLK